MTRGEIRSRILRALNDSGVGAPVYWSTEEMDASINDGMELLAEQTLAIKRTFRVPRRTGTIFYHLDGCGEDLIVPYRLWLPDLERRLESWSMTDLDAHHEQWMTVQGDPWVWFPVDWRVFGIWPAPGNGGGWLEVNAYCWPAPLADDTSRPEFLPADHEALVWWGEFEGWMKQRFPERGASRLAAFSKKWANAASRTSVEQMQAGFHVRTRTTSHGKTHNDWPGS